MNLDIIQETPWWIAVAKPTGMVVEKHGAEGGSLEALVKENLLQRGRRDYIGVVHRLDLVTSGLVLFARKRMALKILNRQFATGEVEKTYLAVTHWSKAEREGRLEHYLIRKPNAYKTTVSNQSFIGTKRGVLHYKVLEIKNEKMLTLVKPETGKYHQIRAQLAHIGIPVIGDNLYGKEDKPSDSIALHAWKLRFRDPQTRIEVNLTTPPPHDFPWKLFSEEIFS